MGERAQLRVGVVVATLGRPQEAGDLLERLRRQTELPSVIVLSVESDDDLPCHLPGDVEVVLGPRGLTAQRNRGMNLLGDRCEIIAFFDDDYLPSATAIAGIEALFRGHPQVAGATGVLLADGVHSGGIKLDDALALLTRFDAATQPVSPTLRRLAGVYGCNMAFRRQAVGELLFDERMPLYGWQEDIDFAARVGQRGWIVKTSAFVGVHRGVVRGRTSGARLGYSQIINPAYLLRKRTIEWPHALALVFRNLAANHFRALWPEPWIDRRGRLAGNWRGLADLARGRIDPMNVLDL